MRGTETRSIQIRDITISEQDKVVIQSMCNAQTGDMEITVAQILQLGRVDCGPVRMAVIDGADTAAITKIRKRTYTPLVADIHYNYRLAIAAIKTGIDKICLNPGDIGSKGNVKAVMAICKEYHIPIRIGINSGSLERDIHERYGKPIAEGMMENAQRHVQILEGLDFHDICLSFKSSDPLFCVDAYCIASTAFPYPLHLGIAETGTFIGSTIKSSMAPETLLNESIGDTIHINVSGDPVNRITVVKQLLKCYGLLKNAPNLIACPTCGRTTWDIQPVINEMRAFLQTIDCDVNVAIIGCTVNGSGETKHADITITGSRNEGLLIKRGEITEKLPQEQMVAQLKGEILVSEKEHS